MLRQVSLDATVVFSLRNVNCSNKHKIIAFLACSLLHSPSPLLSLLASAKFSAVCLSPGPQCGLLGCLCAR